MSRRSLPVLERFERNIVSVLDPVPSDVTVRLMVSLNLDVVLVGGRPVDLGESLDLDSTFRS